MRLARLMRDPSLMLAQHSSCKDMCKTADHQLHHDDLQCDMTAIRKFYEYLLSKDTQIRRCCRG